MDDASLLEALRWMLLSRAYDQRAIALQRQGRYGLVSPALGQEASVVGSALALDPTRDWIVPQYREVIALVRHGYPLDRIAAMGIGRITDAARIPDSVNILPTQIAIAAQLPHATGLAWGLKLQGKDAVVLTYLGDGASSEGDFHEALNLAGVKAAPVVFFLQNNQFAISTPRRLQSATDSLASRAAGYGFAGVTVDGNDLLAVFDAVTQAVKQARAGGGPTLIESITYRMSFHNTTDNPSQYEREEEHVEAGNRDPIDRVTRYLTARGALDDGIRRGMERSVHDEIEATFQRADTYPRAEPRDLFDHVYASLPERVVAQRADFMSEAP